MDIETTGLFLAKITTIVLYDGRTIRYYVHGQNLDDFLTDVADYRLLVTYNGKSFDVPFIEGHFHVRLSQTHIDLRWPLWSLGLRGGLKGCERLLGISRPGLEDIDGFIAPLLWDEYRSRKNVKALETLLAYNIQDTLSLQTLMVHAYNEKVKATPFSGSHSLPSTSLPESPFKADHDTVERVRHRAFGPEALFVASPSISQ
ncbi:MAG TPA: ribonuclease H-like domain-containing protein [Gemmataceae bacterium]|nr:ribonuclease H-like domain-containing protein [Gemmataceae bacterium]